MRLHWKVFLFAFIEPLQISMEIYLHEISKLMRCIVTNCLYLNELHTIKLFSLLKWWNNQMRTEETKQQHLPSSEILRPNFRDVIDNSPSNFLFFLSAVNLWLFFTCFVNVVLNSLRKFLSVSCKTWFVWSFNAFSFAFLKFLSKALRLWCLFLVGICSRYYFHLLLRKHSLQS